MRICKFILSFSLYLAVLPALSAGDGLSTPERLREELEFLTHPEREGRATGTPGAQSTAFYLLRELRNLGLRTTVQCFGTSSAPGRNVVAVTPGWYRDYIVVSAYYDGLGFIGDSFYPGADSNASGVVALLSLARGLSGLCDGGTGLIFVAFDGHNSGLSGSKAFLERFSKEYRMRMAVNLDILGSSLVPVHSGRTDYLIALGGRQHYLLLENLNREFGLDLSYDYYGSRQFTELFYRKVSDQSWFLEAGVPSLMFTSGITLNTNKASDTVETLDLPLLSKRISFIFRFLASLV